MRNRKLLKILLISIRYILAIVLVEFILLFFSILLYPRLTVSDKLLGWKYKPTKNSHTRHFSSTLSYDISINSDGFRDTEFIPPGQKAYRIMVLGDSFTLGLEVDQSKTFCTLLEQKLKKAIPNIPAEVMNMGQPGYSLGQQFLCLQEYGKKFNPNVAVMVISGKVTIPSLTNIMSAGRFVPHYVISNNGIKLISTQNIFQRLLSISRDVSFLSYALVNRLPHTRRVLSKKSTPTNAQLEILVTRLLRNTFDFCSQNRIPLVIIYTDTVRDTYYHQISALCREQAIPFIFLPLKEEYQIRESGHWNVYAHGQIANQIYTFLAEEKLIPSP